MGLIKGDIVRIKRGPDSGCLMIVDEVSKEEDKSGNRMCRGIIRIPTLKGNIREGGGKTKRNIYHGVWTNNIEIVGFTNFIPKQRKENKMEITEKTRYILTLEREEAKELLNLVYNLMTPRYPEIFGNSIVIKIRDGLIAFDKLTNE